MAPRLVSDAIAALTAANAELCLAATGVVGLLDFGGGGTSATLISLAGDFELVTPTMRYAAFSGDEIDQALLLKVFEELGHGSGIDPASTAAVGQLGLLREQCRAAKEQLSTETVAEFAAELGGRRCSMKLTRDELGDLIQDRLSGFIYAFDDMLARHKRSWADLSAVVTVGGGASIPLVKERLSVHGRRPVVSPSQPAYAAALGALLVASRGEERDLRTRTSIGLLTAAAGEVVELPAGDVLVIDDEALTDRELAWSQTEYPGDVRAPYAPDAFDEDGPAGWSMRLNLIDATPTTTVAARAAVAVDRRDVRRGRHDLDRRRGLYVVGHRKPPGRAPTVAPRPAPPASSLAPSPLPPPPTAVPAPPSAAPVPSAAPPPPPPPPPSPPPPPPAPVIVTPAPPPVVTTRHPSPPPATSQPPTTTAMTTTPPPPSTTATSAPPPTPSTTPTTTVPMTTEWIHVPLLPVPIPVPVPQNQAPQAPQRPQYPGNSQNPFLSPGY